MHLPHHAHIIRMAGIGFAMLALSACAADRGTGRTAFVVRTTPDAATVETTQGFRCTTPCQVPLNGSAFVATITSLGFKPVQIPVAAGQSPGTVDIRLVAQDPGAGAPNPVGAHPQR